jgi:AcrR family transcriptional regulator
MTVTEAVMRKPATAVVSVAWGVALGTLAWSVIRSLPVSAAAFAASSSASLSAIARQAGVGIGTLYRHFPSREALIVELYRHDIHYLIDLAPALAASRPALGALRLWFGEVARYGQLKYGAAEIIHAATSDDEYHEPFVRAIAVLLDHGAADGSLKKGLDPEDVLLQLSVLWRIDPERGGEARAKRILDLIIDGLQARPPGTH